MATSGITVGIDIGTSSVKAVAADGDGNVLARTRVAHELRIPSPLRLEHDARDWADGPRAAVAALREAGIEAAAGVSVAAMVPSLTAVDAAGVPVAPGLLYGDERGHTGARGNPAESGELAAFLRWLAGEHPDAAGFWPAQTLANHALAGAAAISTTLAATAYPLFDWSGWDAAEVAAAGARIEQMPAIAPSMRPCAEVPSLGGAVLEPGTIDALGEQLVAGADSAGDVLVICGTTLIVWVVTAEMAEADGCYSIPHTAPGSWLVGGPSNAGGLFLDWARRLVREGGAAPDDPGGLPMWVPYPRGERVPVADPARRAELIGLDLTHGPAHARRAAYEAAGFVTRRILERSGQAARRIVAVGGGVQDPAWIQALADCTRLPVAVSGSPDGGALGAAFLARVAAGLEPDTQGAARWARTAAVVEPDLAWAAACDERYEQWCARA
jgi:xylulokinase